MKKTFILIILVILAVIGAVFFLNEKSPTVDQESPSSFDESITEQSSESATEREFTVNGKNFSFEPSTMMVRKGDKVRVVFKNIEGFHDFTIDEFSVASKRINTGEQEMVEFIADKTGSFEYYCSVGNHRAMGMKGTLIVE